MDGVFMDLEIMGINGGIHVGMEGDAGQEAKFIVVNKIMVWLKFNIWQIE